MTDPKLTAEQQLAAKIADQAESGEVPPDMRVTKKLDPPNSSDSPVSINLAHLARIASAHRAAQNLSHKPEVGLFEWRHLNVESEVGRGGFGTVYRAWDTVLKRRVALKLVSEELATENRDRLMIAEAQRMARVRHVNILAVHGADTADGRTGIWSDLLTGHTLEQVVDDQGSLTSPTVLEMALALTDALALIHRKGITHGDIKPANIMIQDDSTPVLMDFGAAQGVAETQPSYGSPLVMAPEQFCGVPASSASDIYSFGATLYLALRGQFPHETDSFDALARRHQRGAEIDWSGMPARWRKLLRRMLQADPPDRPTAPQVLSQLNAIRAARPRLIRRLATGAVMASLAVGVVTAWLAYRTSEQSLARTERVKTLIIDAIGQTSPNAQSGPATFEATYRRLAELAEERLQDYPAGLANMRTVAAKGLNYLGQTDEALALARRGHELTVQVLSDDPNKMYDSWITLTSLLRQTGDLEGALVAAENSLAELDKLPDSEEVTADRLTSQNHLASIHGYRGDWHRYVQAHEQLLVQRRLLHGEGSVRLAVDHHNIATGQAAYGAFAQSIEHSHAAARLLESSGDAQSVRMGYVIQTLANTLGRAGRHADALVELGRSKNLLEASLPADHERLFTVRISQAYNRYHQGEIDSSIADLRAVLERAPPASDNWVMANAMLADMLLDQGQWQEASGRFQAVLGRLKPRLSFREPYYTGAMAYSAYRQDSSLPSPLNEIENAISKMQSAGYDRVPLFARLGQWESELRE